eukprot:m.45868 g.45868  ORF g.45868 m.45868 type:complete len:267 (-) comp7238_c0_seq1:1382-2182(-)
MSDQTELCSHQFNGGKMNHIFKQNEKFLYVNEFTCEAAERCFKDMRAKVTLKVDGECAMLKRGQAEAPVDDNADSNAQLKKWIFYRRQDNYKGEEESIPVPEGPQPGSFQSHNYSFVPLGATLVTGKGKKKSFVGEDTYAAIDVGVTAGLIPDPNDDSAQEFITVEWVGQKHQLNMDFCPAHHGIVVHGTTPVKVPRTFEEVAEMAATCAIEGVVFEDGETGERFKLKFTSFQPSLFNLHKRKHKPTTGISTTIKPTIITKDGVIK